MQSELVTSVQLEMVLLSHLLTHSQLELLHLLTLERMSQLSQTVAFNHVLLTMTVSLVKVQLLWLVQDLREVATSSLTQLCSQVNSSQLDKSGAETQLDLLEISLKRSKFKTMPRAIPILLQSSNLRLYTHMHSQLET